MSILAGEALDGTPTVVRVRGGHRAVTEGPYAEAVGQLGEFYLIENRIWRPCSSSPICCPRTTSSSAPPARGERCDRGGSAHLARQGRA